MKLQIFSDIHLDFHRDKGKAFVDSMPVLADTAVVAGDLCESDRVINVLEMLCAKWKRVIFVLGNHDCYRSSISVMKRTIRNKKPDNLIFLDNKRVKIGGQWFVGGTLWFADHPDVFMYSHYLSDFRRISSFPVEAYVDNKKFMELLRDVQPDDVAVSHHLPNKGSVAKRYQGDPTNVFFMYDVGLELLDGPKLWIHGHTHTPFDYTVTKTRVENGRDTRVVCNPLGYPGELDTKFNDSLVVEV